MNDPRIPITTSVNCVERKAASALTESMEAHPSVSRTLELLAADMNAYPARILPVEMCLIARIFSLVGQVDVQLNYRFQRKTNKSWPRT